MAIHELKIQPQYFDAIIRGDKTFEIRKDDRGYAVDDLLVLKEWENEQYTGHVIIQKVTYTTTYAQEMGFLVLAIKEPDFDVLNQHFGYNKAACLNMGYEPTWVLEQATDEDLEESISAIDAADVL